MKPRSLAGRIALLVGVATMAILGVASVVMDQWVDAEMAQRFDSDLVSQANALSALATLEDGRLALGDSDSPHARWLSEIDETVYAMRCSGGQSLLSDPAPARYPESWAERATAQPAYQDISIDHRVLRAVWFRFQPELSKEPGENASAAAGAGSCSIIFMQPRTKLDDILEAIDGILVFTPMLALLAVLLITPMLVRRGLKPLALLGNEMRHIGPQAPGKRLPETGTRELEPLVGRFNGVLERMDEGVNRERQFAGALAHETRTRLAELRVLVDVERRYPSGRPIDGLLAEIGNIGGELESTVSGLLLLTRLDAGVESMQRIEVDLDSVLERQIEHVAPTLSRRGLRLDWQRLPVAGTVIADPSLLAIVIGNLLGNASTYAPEGSVIVIRHEGPSLIISNAAPGLDSSDVSHFGQRFWSKHPGSEGHAGLGLALAGAAARAMDFQLAFQLDPSQQLRVVLGWGG
ncbi:hypothetical protein CS053_01060 [Rhodanobacter glycinis]|uniref:histidine kinase n=1 Tax=Rhodanobacter glycinis TaxID=582702 RepID=A0A5B9DXB0_9GAMM|nr:HAMP domain-containing sensor histidine kinase [Rhodanobacter glycinis]QEE23241.1 hypothetical protein CS053_01060 [Rhodanobacter glycinis]